MREKLFISLKNNIFLSKKEKAYFCILMTIIVWSFTPAVMKVCYHGLEPATFNFFRLVFTNIFLLLILYIKNKYNYSRNIKTFRVSTYLKKKYIVLGALTIFPYLYFFLLGLKNTSSSLAGLLIGMAPIWTIIFGYFLDFYRPKINSWVGIMVAFIGMIFFFLDYNFLKNINSDFFFTIPNFLIIFSTICFSIYTVFSRRMSNNISPILSMYYIFCGALIPFSFVMLYELCFFSFHGFSLINILGIIYMAIFGTGIGYVCFFYSVDILGSSVSSIVLNIVPITTFGFGIIFLKEPIIEQQIIAALIIISGIVISNLKIDINYGKKKDLTVPIRINTNGY